MVDFAIATTAILLTFIILMKALFWPFRKKKLVPPPIYLLKKWNSVRWFGGFKIECEECHRYGTGFSVLEAKEGLLTYVIEEYIYTWNTDEAKEAEINRCTTCDITRNTHSFIMAIDHLEFTSYDAFLCEPQMQCARNRLIKAMGRCMRSYGVDDKTMREVEYALKTDVLADSSICSMRPPS